MVKFGMHRSALAIATVAAAIAVSVSSGGPADAAGGGFFSLQVNNAAVSIQGNVSFDSNGIATVTATGYDNKADGLGPYLEIEAQPNYPGLVTRSCAAGAGSSCTIPTWKSSEAEGSIHVIACLGKGGQVTQCGDGAVLKR